MRERLQTFNATGRALPISCGAQHATGGEIFYWKAVGRLFYIAYAVSWGELGSLDHKLITIGGHSVADLGLLLGSSINVYLGTTTNGGVPDPIMKAAEPRWNFTYPGIAWVAVRLDSSNPVAAEVNPLDFECVVEGIKNRDPRTSFVTRSISGNAARIAADLRTSQQYGVGDTDAMLGWTSPGDENGVWSESADDCDATIATQGSAPGTAPTVTPIATPSGWADLTHALYYAWVYTWIVNGVETPPSPASSTYQHDKLDVGTGATKFLRITVTNGPAGTTAKKIYRNRGGNLLQPASELPKQLVGVIQDNTTATFDDRVADAALSSSTPPPVATVKRYELGFTLREQAPASSVFEMIRASCGAFFPYNDGKTMMVIEKARTHSSIGFSDQNLLARPRIRGKPISEIPTKLICRFADKNNGYKDSQVQDEHPNVSTPPTEAERLESRPFDYRLYGTLTYDQAKRRCRELFNRGILDKEFELLVDLKGITPLPGARCNLDSVVYNLPLVEITVTGIQPAGRRRFLIRAEPYDENVNLLTLQTEPKPLFPTLGNPLEPSIGDFVPSPGRAYDVGDGTTYWNEPPNLVAVTQYGTASWTNNGFPSYDGTKVNDGDFSGQAFTLNTASAAWNTLDLGPGQSKAFRGFRITASQAFHSSESLQVEYSDDNAAWTAVPSTGAIENGRGLSTDYPHFVAQWDSTAGAHRYWRYWRTSGNAQPTPIVELQFFEIFGGPSRVDHYEVWDFYTIPTLIKTIHATSRPTADKPLELINLIAPANNTINIEVFAVNPKGARSAGFFSQLTAQPVTAAANLRIQSAAGAATRQVGAVAVDRVAPAILQMLSRGLSLSNGDNHNVALGSFSTQRITGPTAAYGITGFDAANAKEGDIVPFWNTPAQTLTLKHQNAGSSAGNRIICPGGTDVAYAADAIGLVQYDDISDRWRVLEKGGAGGGGGGGMGTLKWQADSITSLETTGLNSLATGAAALSAAYDNATNLNMFGDFELVVTFGTAPVDGTLVGVYLVQALDGTNYADGAAGTSAVFGESHYRLAFPVRAVTTGQRITVSGVSLPPTLFKAQTYNRTAQAFAATGNTLKMVAYREQNV